MSALNEKKTRALVAYIASKSDVGKTKLMKLLYLMDFTMYEKTRKSITNDEYKHWRLCGPVPVTVWKKMRDDFPNDLLNVEGIPCADGTYLKFTPKDRNIDMSIFSADERTVIDEILEKFGEKFQEELVEKVHVELPLRITDKDETIPYFLACYRNYDAKEKRRRLKSIRNDKELMKRVREKYEKSLAFFAQHSLS